MPPPELTGWTSLIKDTLLGIAAFVTTVVAIYGDRMWKRELAGKEIYAATKNLVRKSHLLSQAAQRARQPIKNHERKIFSEEEIKHTTENERWRLSEAGAYNKRIDDLSLVIDNFQNALLEVRVLVGSKVYLGFLPFNHQVTEIIVRLSDYVVLLQDHSQTASPNSSEVLDAQRKIHPSENHDDDLTQQIDEAREEGEKCLLSFLHRTSIRG